MNFPFLFYPKNGNNTTITPIIRIEQKIKYKLIITAENIMLIIYSNSNLFLSLSKICLKSNLIDLTNQQNKTNTFPTANTTATIPKKVPFPTIVKHITTLIIDNRDINRNLKKN